MAFYFLFLLFLFLYITLGKLLFSLYFTKKLDLWFAINSYDEAKQNEEKAVQQLQEVPKIFLFIINIYFFNTIKGIAADLKVE